MKNKKKAVLSKKRQKSSTLEKLKVKNKSFLIIFWNSKNRHVYRSDTFLHTPFLGMLYRRHMTIALIFRCR